jgi:hypothetical protein
MTTEPSEGVRQLTVEGVYAQIIKVHHYYLNWRHAILAGYVVVTGALVVAAGWMIDKYHANLLWLTGAIGAFVSLWSWIIEYRNRVIYRQCESVARTCELNVGSVAGRLYHRFDAIDDKCWLDTILTILVSHSVAVDFLYWSAFVVLSWTSFILFNAPRSELDKLVFSTSTEEWMFVSVAEALVVAIILGFRIHGYCQRLKTQQEVS